MGERACPDDATVCLVATRPATFEACRAGYYPCPSSYPRASAAFDVLGCYRTAPVSAVTHYAPVEARTRERRTDGGVLGEADWARLLDPAADADEATVFHLGPLRALEAPVAADSGGVRGAWYPRLGDLRDCASLSDLRDRMDGY